MDSATTETINNTKQESMGFFNFVFNFDEENKNEIVNMFQYALLAIIPVLLTLKIIKFAFPEEDESKGSLEIMMEAIGQLIFILGMIWFSDKMIRYIPTYSKMPYSKFTPINFLLPFLILLSTLQSKFAAKINILYDRTLVLIKGPQEDTDPKSKNVRVSQPISGVSPDRPNTQLLPSDPNLTRMPMTLPNAGGVTQPIQPQQSPDFNNMYSGPTTSLVDANSPLQQEPLAANEAFGNMFGGSPW